MSWAEIRVVLTGEVKAERLPHTVRVSLVFRHRAAGFEGLPPGLWTHFTVGSCAAHPETGSAVRAVQTKVKELTFRTRELFLSLGRGRFSFMVRDDNNSYYLRYPDQSVYPDRTGKTAL